MHEVVALAAGMENDSTEGVDRAGSSAFLTSLQLADSFFPSGLYTLSYGLEAFAQSGLLRANGLEALLMDYLRHAVGPSDGAALACAHRGIETGDLDVAAEADIRLAGVKLPKEARTSSQRLGRQLLKTAVIVFGGELIASYLDHVNRSELPGNHSVALGLIAAAHGVEREQAVMGELYAFASGALAASVRLAVIDHLFAQAVLHRLKPVISEVGLRQCESRVQDIAGSAPLIDIMAMQHERASLRLFVS
ncbi:MAG TPA: urease accessory UreF family protein [Nitrosospira sp.]|nr:urease accessory UreF family protein [Nitrosospira sp.]